VRWLSIKQKEVEVIGSCNCLLYALRYLDFVVEITLATRLADAAQRGIQGVIVSRTDDIAPADFQMPLHVTLSYAARSEVQWRPRSA
jgi:hypothetical protein